MILIDSLFAASYSSYVNGKDHNPAFKAVCIISLIEMFFFLIFLLGLEKLNIVKLRTIIPNKFLLLPFLFATLYLNYRYFKGRVESILPKYKEKPLWEKRTWGIITIVIIVFEVLFFLLLIEIG